MGILDDVIAGKDGIVNLTHNLLGGIACLIYVNKTEEGYDYETATFKYSDNDVTEPVPFVPRKIGSKYVTSNNQDLIERANIIGTIPSNKILSPLRNGIDKFTYRDVTYTIIQTDRVSIGNKEALTVLYGKETNE